MWPKCRCTYLKMSMKAITIFNEHSSIGLAPWPLQSSISPSGSLTLNFFSKDLIMGLGFPSKRKACDKIYRSEAVPLGGATERRAASHETSNSLKKNAVSLGWRDDLAVKT